MLTLLRRESPLADPAEQLRRLAPREDEKRFELALADSRLPPLAARGIDILQINVGKLCNQTCGHCHVDAGPDRREVMSRETMELCLEAAADGEIPTLDITGGAPELNPYFRWLVEEADGRGHRVIDRCNLTIMLVPGFSDLPEFFAEHRVEVVASLPCYLKENTDAQRGEGVFDRSIEALKRLNATGYGRSDTGLTLTLVYNPIGPVLPPAQAKLEAAYRQELRSRYGVEFTRLYTIANMPINRFLDDLLTTGRYETYMQELIAAFNPRSVGGLMCRNTISVNWDGTLHDCDFNQMLGLGLAPDQPLHIRDFHPAKLKSRRIVTGQHCYGCTAGAGSGCQGAIVK